MSEPAVVLGSGANELVAAHVLARAGRRVVVLEGKWAHDEQDAGWVAPRVLRAAGVDSAAVDVVRPDPWASAPLPAGDRLDFTRDVQQTAEAIRRLSERDAARWPEFCERMARVAEVLEKLYLAPPPDLVGKGMRDLVQLAGFGVKLRSSGRQALEDLLRIAAMPVADLLDDWFESDAVKGVLAAAGVAGFFQGPRSGGTALRFVHQHVGNAPGVFRPPRSNLRTVLASMSRIEICHDAEAERIVVREGRVAGVVLRGGEEIATTLVMSGADPQRTLLTLADAGWLDPELVRAVRNIRSRGVVARVTLATARAPDWSTLAVAPSLDYLERACDDAKYGNLSRAPYLEVRSAGRWADGRCRLDVHMQYAPYALADALSDDILHARLGRLTLDTLARHAGDIGPATVESVLAPRDLEARYGYPQGQAEQVEPALDQSLWMRPLPELARYRTPIEGLYLCGTAMHPGGGMTGGPGYNAAREALRDLRRA